MASIAFSSAEPTLAQLKLSQVSGDTLSCTHSLFERPWWLDAVAPGAWDAVVVVKNGEIVGRLPFVRKRRLGLTILGQPMLTQFLGPWIKTEMGKPQTQLEREHNILRSLIAALPSHDVFNQNFHHSVTNCLPFTWQGFSHSVDYTYIIDDLRDLDKIWDGFRKTLRTHIRNAERQVIVRVSDDIEPLIALNRMVFERQGLPPRYPADLIRRLDVACRAHSARRLFLAEDTNGAPHAALYLVWDSESAYDLLGGSDPRLRNSNAMSLLRWEAIKYASQVTRRFDFEGSMLENVEQSIRSFGGRQVQYARITRGGTLKGRFALLANEIRRARWRPAA
jgi:hypothetical protein